MSQVNHQSNWNEEAPDQSGSSSMDYPKRSSQPETLPAPTESLSADAGTRMGLAHRDMLNAQRRFTDAVLELHAESPLKLDQQRTSWDVPSREVNEVLRRFRKLL